SACTSFVGGKLDITFKRPDPNAIIMLGSTPETYAAIQISDGANTSHRTVVVRETGQIQIQNQ
ncbi:MAG: hypothetical protein KGJ35_01845, partial [Patescibacteria group bacterium]|nr:hypothetical protein [Patescibacteria group bacterium]